ncbi:MAG: PTS lactose/cellobiose transporter subunit IIA [Lachnospiraceae bacterium]|jgi:PTS system cellobiose-specific IIA component|nr:PTS lactose/cellobiose transporter subunit IIA [Lachnospiraceae bacterium]
MNEQNYEQHFQLIVAAGESRTKSMLAIEAAREGRFEDAQRLLNEASDVHVQAHDLQMEMLRKEAEGDPVTVNIIAVHAQDHLTMATLIEDIATEQIETYRRLKALEEQFSEYMRTR